MSKTRNSWLAAGLTLLLVSGAPGFVAPSLMQTAEAQSQKITGTVVDEFGDPVIGANIRVKGTTIGAVTDIDGKFSLDTSAGSDLEISFIGYVSESVKAAPGMTITLREDSQSLEDVVVVGYGTQKKKLVTGATVQVKGEDIAKLNTSNALTAMQATTPGVNITQSSTQPGQGFKVNVRGLGTVNGSSPLLIIDGVNAGTADNGLNGLNPNEIESIDVLKDAASAAIYGARAANGVILVTTKQGKAGKVSVQYDGYVGWSNPYKRPNTLNAQEYMQVINETMFNYTGSAPVWNTIVPQAIVDKVNAGWEGTDWFEEYRNENALQHSHALNLTGGTDRSKFSVSLSYSKQNGIMGGEKASNYERFGGRINSDHVIYRTDSGRDVVKLGENLSYWYHNGHSLAESNGYWNIMQGAYSASPLVMPFDEEGNLLGFNTAGAGYSTMIYSNPLNGLYNGQFGGINKNRDFGVGATFYLEIEPIKNLKWRGSMNTGFSASHSRSFTQPFSVSNTSSGDSYQTSQSENQGGSITLEHTLSYTLPDLGGHHIDVMIGQSMEQSLFSQNMNVNLSTSSSAAGSLLLNGWDYAMMSNYETKDDITGFSGGDFKHQATLHSFFGRINYNYKEKYMLTLIARRDASKEFGDGKRSGYFPSVSAGWVVTNEKWAEPVTNFMDFFKIRGSWGQNGNCNSPKAFPYLSNIYFSPTDYADYGYKFSSDPSYTVNGKYVTGAYAYNQPNPDLSWETSQQLDLGFDARFFNSRLGVAFDWYKKDTKDWIIEAPLIDIFGYEAPSVINGGKVTNTGIEVALTWNDNIGKDFQYHVNFNFATNKNEVKQLGTASGTMGQEVGDAIFENSGYAALVKEGHPIGYFSGMTYSGIWQNQAEIDAARAAGKAVLGNAQPGDPIWEDYNGDGSIVYAEVEDGGDRHEIGNPNPDVTIGANIGFSWKGLDFAIQGAGAFGQQVLQCYRTALLANPYVQYTTDVFDRWTGEGTNNSRPRYTVGGEANQWVSPLYMQDADYFKIQNVTIGYDVKKVWKACPFSQLRVYAQAQNLYTFTGYTGVDPEIGSNGGNGNGNWISGIDVGLYPSARTYLVGVNIKF